MPERAFLQHGGAPVLIETTTAAGAGDAPMGPKCTRAVQELARAFAQALGELKDAAPDEVSINFGLGVAGNGQFVVMRGQTEANFVVNFRWGGAQAGFSAPLLPLQE